MILDTSVVYAYFVRSDPDHERVASLIDAVPLSEPLVVSPFVVAELDYLIATRFGVTEELAALRELSVGAWEIAEFTSEDLSDAARIVEKYRELDIGVTDASLVVLAARFGTSTIATLDRRHFEALRSPRGTAFELLPAT